MKTIRTAVLAIAILAVSGAALGGELGHYNPGMANIRDYLVPEPGWWESAAVM